MAEHPPALHEALEGDQDFLDVEAAAAGEPVDPIAAGEPHLVSEPCAACTPTSTSNSLESNLFNSMLPGSRSPAQQAHPPQASSRGVLCSAPGQPEAPDQQLAHADQW
jgi:hypothetical protein